MPSEETLKLIDSIAELRRRIEESNLPNLDFDRAMAQLDALAGRRPENSKSANELAMDVGDAMEEYLTAKQRHDAARDYANDDWDSPVYRHHRESLKKAAAFLGQALDAYNNR